MSKFRQELKEHLAIRLALGFTIRSHGSTLRDFVGFLENRQAQWITSELAVSWARKPADADPNWWAYRLSLARQFACHMKTKDPRTEIPQAAALPFRLRRPAPYIYSQEEIAGLIQAARALPSHNGLRAWTYSTLFGLVSVCGLRISEALKLNRQDMDGQRDVLAIRESKYRKTRLVPLHSTTSNALRAYARQRDQRFQTPRSESFFVTVFGRRPTYGIVNMTFGLISRQIGLREPKARRGPRIHDLRHTFAVRSLIDLYRRGGDLEQGVHALSVYLGHTGPSSTYWYLTAVPELMHWACRRLEGKGGKPL
jgi:integrase/recombinase XerD